MTACEFGCCSPEVAALRDGGWVNTDKGWKLDDRRREHVNRVHAAAMARCDRITTGYPVCPCGQRAIKLDAAGLCSRIDITHNTERARRGFPAATGRGRR